EMGMSGYGEIEFLTKLARPHYTVITNIGEAHMRDLGSRAGIAKAKFEIVEGMLDGGKLFYDGDEPLLRELVAQHPELSAIAFGFEENNDLIASDIITSENGSTFMVNGLLTGEYFISVLGKHQVKNTLNAMLISQALGLNEEQIRTALRQVVLTDMRMQQLPGVNGSLFINDAYNAAPTSMNAAIEFMKQTTMRSRKWLVLGDMLELGEDEQLFHEQIADVIDAEAIEKVMLYGPRMKWLYDRLIAHYDPANLVYSAEAYEPLIEAVSMADADTIVLYKGSRGMKLETIITASK
ncbi:MAG: UDP-N-acetylmuramoyl-tripeptide--D-alanyl-D-alanine ligase, partial [Lysinibacillus sp.]